MALASENHRSGQLISEYIQKNLAPQFLPDLINPQHFCHSARRKPVRLSKSGKAGANPALPPSATKRFAVSLPMPEPPPVIAATLFSKRMILLLYLSIARR